MKTEYPSGTKHWYLNGKLHREDGPAAEHHSGTKGWYLNGECHREDGPAYEHPDGYKECYLNGQFYYDTKGKLHNNNFLVSNEYTGLVIIMGGKNKIRFMRTINNIYLVIKFEEL